MDNLEKLNAKLDADFDQHFGDSKDLHSEVFTDDFPKSKMNKNIFNLSTNLNNFLLNECAEGKIPVEKSSNFYNVFHTALQNTLTILKSQDINPMIYYVGEGDDKILKKKVNIVEKINYENSDCIFIDIDALIDELINNNINNITYKFLNLMVLSLISKEAKDEEFAYNIVKNI
jgi:hypothetical protein